LTDVSQKVMFDSCLHRFDEYHYQGRRITDCLRQHYNFVMLDNWLQCMQQLAY